MGVALAGATEGDCESLRRYVRDVYRAGPASTLGSTEHFVPEGAAYLNSAAGHVLDFDDGHVSLGGHPTVPVLPSVLALSECHGIAPADTIAAYVVGVEVECAIGRSLNFAHYERGWHPTATLGIFGATAASARLLGLDAAATANALGIAASFASGIKGNFGTFVKPLQVGFAASKGIKAAHLAALGIAPSHDVFKSGSSFSFGEVFNGQGQPIEWAPVKNLGQTWAIARPGLVFKLYPCCASTHGAIDAMLEIRKVASFEARRIRSIDVYEPARRLAHTDRPRPSTALQAKFSVQYVVALAALTGRVTVSDFDNDHLTDPQLANLIATVKTHLLVPEEEVRVDGPSDSFAAKVTVEDDSGVVQSAFVKGPRGSSEDLPINDALLKAKFVDTAAIMLGRESAVAAYATIHRWALGQLTTSELMASVARPAYASSRSVGTVNEEGTATHATTTH